MSIVTLLSADVWCTYTLKVFAGMRFLQQNVKVWFVYMIYTIFVKFDIN